MIQISKLSFKFTKLTSQKFLRYNFSNHIDDVIQKTVYLERYQNDFVVHLCLNNINAKNSLTKELINDLNDTIIELQKDKNIRVLIIKSNVNKIFCAGADLKERLTMNYTEVSFKSIFMHDVYIMIFILLYL